MQVRGAAAAVIFLMLGIALITIGLTGRLGVLTAAVLAPTTVEPA